MRPEVFAHLKRPQAFLYCLIVLAHAQVIPAKMRVPLQIQRIDLQEALALRKRFSWAAECNEQMRVIMASLRMVSLSESVIKLQRFGCGRNNSWIGLHRRECSTRPKRAIGRSQPGIRESKLRVQFDRPVEISNAFLQLLR